MMKIFCDDCGKELPKPGSKKPIMDTVVTKFNINGQPYQEKLVHCEDCTDKILTFIKTLTPVKLIQ